MSGNPAVRIAKRFIGLPLEERLARKTASWRSANGLPPATSTTA